MAQSVIVKLLHKILITTIALSLCACAHYQLQTPEPNPAGQLWSKSYVAYFWGAIEQRKIAEQCDRGHGIDLVRVKDNLGYDLISVITLGIVKPIEIEYQCRAQEAQIGSLLDEG